MNRKNGASTGIDTGLSKETSDRASFFFNSNLGLILRSPTFDTL